MALREKRDRVTSKGQMTLPRDIRRVLGVESGDSVVFQADKDGVRVRPVRAGSPFERHRGIGTPAYPLGDGVSSASFAAMRGE